ncbi:MAG: hypothetical protein MHM6MM_008311 [Cercozoa sp. M6MM]
MRVLLALALTVVAACGTIGAALYPPAAVPFRQLDADYSSFPGFVSYRGPPARARVPVSARYTPRRQVQLGFSAPTPRSCSIRTEVDNTAWNEFLQNAPYYSLPALSRSATPRAKRLSNVAAIVHEERSAKYSSPASSAYSSDSTYSLSSASSRRHRHSRRRQKKHRRKLNLRSAAAQHQRTHHKQSESSSVDEICLSIERQLPEEPPLPLEEPSLSKHERTDQKEKAVPARKSGYESVRQQFGRPQSPPPTLDSEKQVTGPTEDNTEEVILERLPAEDSPRTRVYTGNDFAEAGPSGVCLHSTPELFKRQYAGPVPPMDSSLQRLLEQQQQQQQRQAPPDQIAPNQQQQQPVMLPPRRQLPQNEPEEKIGIWKRLFGGKKKKKGAKLTPRNLARNEQWQQQQHDYLQWHQQQYGQPQQAQQVDLFPEHPRFPYISPCPPGPSRLD